MMAAMLVSPSSPRVASQPFLDRSFHQAAPSKTCPDTNKRRSIKISALRRDDYSDKLIDEDMIVLRMRVQEMKIAERIYEASSDWMEWEKRYYRGSYNSDICEAVGCLQSVLMKTRPGLVLGMVGLVALSIPTSVGLVLFHCVEWLAAGNILHL
ncbi:hypothetical protein SADUNF_Sadunf10G0078900 [Salix dunnii]|uniref:Uncharacterized protein n=1 Tax=Salix dunnii TaxID=1413687 RepID=A0A835JSU7_9ROSI|nr:hypothetical protein SADUNF_Sadunf10G0078900 [Salix dunnii]